MALGKLFKSLFGGSPEDASKGALESIEYKGFTIEAAPIPEGSHFRTAGYIVGELDGDSKRVQFIRADQHGDQQAAIDHSFAKGRQIIDERGIKLLERNLL